MPGIRGETARRKCDLEPKSIIWIKCRETKGFTISGNAYKMRLVHERFYCLPPRCPTRNLSVAYSWSHCVEDSQFTITVRNTGARYIRWTRCTVGWRYLVAYYRYGFFPPQLSATIPRPLAFEHEVVHGPHAGRGCRH
jgi:hypothetical protein